MKKMLPIAIAALALFSLAACEPKTTVPETTVPETTVQTHKDEHTVPVTTDEVTTDDAEPVVKTDKAILTPGCEGTVPEIHDEVIEYLKKNFKKSEIEYVGIQSEYRYVNEDDEEMTEFETSVVCYSVTAEKNEYFSVFFDTETKDLRSDYREEEILNVIGKSIVERLKLPEDIVYELYFHDNTVTSPFGIPADIENEDDFMKFFDSNKHSLTLHVVGRTTVLDVGAVNGDDIEKAMSDFGLESIGIYQLHEEKENLRDYRDCDIVAELYVERDDDSTKEKLNLTITKTINDCVKAEDVLVTSDKEFVKIENVSVINPEDIPADKLIDNGGVTAYKAVKIAVRKIKNSSDNYGLEDFREEENAHGGVTAYQKYCVYNVKVCCGSQFDGKYFESYGDMDEYVVDEDISYGFSLFCDLTVEEFDEDGMCTVYFVFYGLSAE